VSWPAHGLAASRIRFYEDAGLLVAQRQANGYRDYPEQAVLLLELITGAQRAGFSLEEIRACCHRTWASGSTRR
jgi:DNA-binding transcriptional MerR regulator